MKKKNEKELVLGEIADNINKRADSKYKKNYKSRNRDWYDISMQIMIFLIVVFLILIFNAQLRLIIMLR